MFGYWQTKRQKVRPRRRLLSQKEAIAMSDDSKARLRVAALIFCMVSAVIFGCGVILVMSLPALDAFFWIPAVVISSLVISAPVAWFIAPWMMMRFLKARPIN